MELGRQRQIRKLVRVPVADRCAAVPQRDLFMRTETARSRVQHMTIAQFAEEHAVALGQVVLANFDERRILTAEFGQAESGPKGPTVLQDLVAGIAVERATELRLPFDAQTAEQRFNCPPKWPVR